MQAVRTLIERLAFDADGVGKGDCRIFIGAGPPDLSVGNDFPPNRAAFHQRAMVIDGDIGDANPLAHDGVLAIARNIQLN